MAPEKTASAPIDDLAVSDIAKFGAPQSGIIGTVKYWLVVRRRLKELALELQPGYIEEHVHARLKLRQTQSLRFSWLYAFRMGVYGVTAMVLALFLPPIILKFPFGQQIDFAAYFNGLAALTARLLPSIQFSFLVVGLGSTFMIASVLYSLAFLRK